MQGALVQPRHALEAITKKSTANSMCIRSAQGDEQWIGTPKSKLNATMLIRPLKTQLKENGVDEHQCQCYLAFKRNSFCPEDELGL